MRFVDEATIRVESGAGGNGCVSFRREKFVPMGGPDGGNGGRGGDVVLVATTRRSSLLEFRGQTHWRAERGQNGLSKQMTGARGKPMEITVPVGTRVIDVEEEVVLGDLVKDGDRLVVAQGGRGGLGNLYFKSSTNRAPRKSVPGGPSESRHLRLELMLMADVGLLGYPNAGKSTLISKVSAARPKIASYPFTTLVPSLGVVAMGYENFVIADIPGLIEGASEGVGLGLQFLRHVSRTRLLLHLLSLAPDERVPAAERYRNIRRELRRYDAKLLERPELIVLTKADLLPPEALEEVVAETRAELPEGVPVFTISSELRTGLDPLMTACWDEVCRLRAAEEGEE
jgi:GTP-binding protein